MSFRKRFGELSISGESTKKVAKKVIFPKMIRVKVWEVLLVFLINAYCVNTQKVIFSNDGLTIHAVKSGSYFFFFFPSFLIKKEGKEGIFFLLKQKKTFFFRENRIHVLPSFLYVLPSFFSKEIMTYVFPSFFIVFPSWILKCIFSSLICEISIPVCILILICHL